MTSLVERQAPIDREVVNALIAATPETWSAAEMFVEREQDSSHEKMKIEISSPEGHRDLVGPTDEIYAGLYNLSDLFREYGKVWSQLVYRANLTPEGNWKYTIRFDY